MYSLFYAYCPRGRHRLSETATTPPLPPSRATAPSAAATILIKIGNIQSDGVIRNSNGAQIGKLENDGTVRDRSGRHIGKIESDGTVRNSNNSQIGKVESDGTVRNSNNSSIGSAKGVPQRYAALYFFFDFFK